MRILHSIIILVVLSTIIAFAAVPPMVNYQGKLTKADGTLLADGTYSMTFAIYNVPTTGLPLWWETNSSVQVKKGLFSVLLGSVRPFAADTFSDEVRWFGVKVGEDTEMSPRQQIAAVPFAFKAALADKAIIADRSTIADKAIIADKATLADKATIADTATLADNATNAINATNATIATNAINATNATTATNAINAVNATNAVTAGNGVPVGGVIMWSGAVIAIPTGWALCNGQNGTPDLRDKFIVGAGGGYTVGATGGLATVTLNVDQIPSHGHSVNDPGHTHGISDPGHYHSPQTGGSFMINTGGNQPGGTGTAGVDRLDYQTDRKTTGISINLSGTGISIYNTGGGQPHENRPPYYALCFIMKTGN